MKLKDIETIVLGNRLTAASYALIAGAYSRAIINNESDFISFSAWSLGIFFAVATLGGYATYHHYKKALKHVAVKGKLEFDFLKKEIRIHGRNKYLGYCELQGLYLAARDSGNEKMFRKLRKYSRNIVPNF